MDKTRRSLFLGATAASAALAPSAAAAPKSLDTEVFRNAVTAGDIEAVSQFLDRDPALVYARDSHGNSVYILACLAGKAEIAELMAKRGLALDIFEAAVSGNVRRATELSKLFPGITRMRSADGRTPLHFATAAGKADMVAFLGSHGADLSAGPESPLLAAVDYPDGAIATQMGTFLLGNGSSPNAERADGKTAVELAAARGHDELVEMLIHRGADPSSVPKLRSNSTIDRVYFARRYERDVRGAKVTRDDTNGLPQDFINHFVTVAHFDFEEVKRLYKSCPALLMTRATWDELAVEAAAHMGLVPMADYLADLGSPVSTCTATILGLSARVREALQTDALCLYERGAHDLPLLAYTAFGKEQLEIAELFLKAGARVDVRGFGQTTLHIAAAKGHIALAKLLLDHGADVNAGKVTPAAIALRSKQYKIADFLTSHGGHS